MDLSLRAPPSAVGLDFFLPRIFNDYLNTIGPVVYQINFIAYQKLIRRIKSRFCVFRCQIWLQFLKKFKKALGVYGISLQSGSGPNKTKRGREGSKDTRSALFMICLNCIRNGTSDNDFRDYYRRQLGQGKPKMKALYSTMGKLAEIIFHCLQRGEQITFN